MRTVLFNIVTVLFIVCGTGLAIGLMNRHVARRSAKRGHRMVAVFGLIGAVAGGVLLALLHPVECGEIIGPEYTSPGASTDWIMTVEFFGRVWYTRTAPNSLAITGEIFFWLMVPVALGALFACVLARYLAGRWLLRAPLTPNKAPQQTGHTNGGFS
jgi:uncharacterized membrane protein YeaQ/YmgE (transglycosylase-associated protein family)